MNRPTTIAVSIIAAAAVSFGAIELMTNAFAEKAADVRACAKVLGPVAVKTAVVPKPCQTFEDVFTSTTTTVDRVNKTGNVATKSVTEYNVPASLAFEKSELAYVRNSKALYDMADYSAPVIGGVAVGGFIGWATKPGKLKPEEPAPQITTSEA